MFLGFRYWCRRLLPRCCCTAANHHDSDDELFLEEDLHNSRLRDPCCDGLPCCDPDDPGIDADDIYDDGEVGVVARLAKIRGDALSEVCTRWRTSASLPLNTSSIIAQQYRWTTRTIDQ